MNLYNNFFFIALPYIALAIFCIGTIYRYRMTGFKYSSLSSQFLESGGLYFGSMAFHWGIVVIFLGHLLAFVFPQATIALNSSPNRLIAIEAFAFTMGLSCFIGLFTLFMRRISNDRVRVVSNRMDILIEIFILAQLGFGCWIALAYRWGSSWFAADLSPYLWSIVKLNPNIEAVSAMPPVIQGHIMGAFIIIAMIPFTRLVHFLVAPFHYIWRPYQRVMWYWDRRKIRDPQTVWTEHRPGNN